MLKCPYCGSNNTKEGKHVSGNNFYLCTGIAKNNEMILTPGIPIRAILCQDCGGIVLTAENTSLIT